MAVTDQFGLFDIAAHVIPGVVVLAAAGWALGAAEGAVPTLPEGFVVATVGLVAAYVVGQLCQLVADTAPMRWALKGPARHAESAESELLRTWAAAAPKEGTQAPAGAADAYGPAVCAAFQATFGLDVPTSTDEDGVKARERRFRAAYAYVMQHGKPERPQMFKAIASFHESMVPASAAVAAAGLHVMQRQGASLTAGLVVGGSVAAVLLFRRAYGAFDTRFAESVYHAFLALAAPKAPRP